MGFPDSDPSMQHQPSVGGATVFPRNAIGRVGPPLGRVETLESQMPERFQIRETIQFPRKFLLLALCGADAGEKHAEFGIARFRIESHPTSILADRAGIFRLFRLCHVVVASVGRERDRKVREYFPDSSHVGFLSMLRRPGR